MENGQSPASTVDIANDGDVVLVVGPDERRLRVSSSSLASASKVFRSMFSPHYSEGQNLGDISSGLKEVPMPEDDADAMEIICSLIHFRSVPEEIDASLMLQIAVAADKFDCGIVLQHASIVWADRTKSKGLVELAQLMAASYLLDNSKAFSKVTLAMVFLHRDSYLALAEQDVGLDLSVLLRICCMFPQLLRPTSYLILMLGSGLLEERRSLLRTEIEQMLFRGATVCGSDNDKCSCAWSGRHSLAYMELLQERGLQPHDLHSMSLTQILDQIDKLDDPEISDCNQQTCRYRWHTNPRYRVARSDVIKSVRDKEGLCIDCVQRGATATARNCRMKH